LFVAVAFFSVGALALALRPARGDTVSLSPDAGAAFITWAPAPQMVFVDSGSEAVAPADGGAARVAEAAADGGRHLVFPSRRGSVNVIALRDGEMFWGQVFLDGVEQGRTPLTLDLAPGRYQL